MLLYSYAAGLCKDINILSVAPKHMKILSLNEIWSKLLKINYYIQSCYRKLIPLKKMEKLGKRKLPFNIKRFVLLNEKHY